MTTQQLWAVQPYGRGWMVCGIGRMNGRYLHPDGIVAGYWAMFLSETGAYAAISNFKV